MKKTVAIIHFNTPELTEAAILSLRKHGGEDYSVVVFDNSTDVSYPSVNGLPARLIKAKPFKKQMKGVRRIDNTKGQVIDFASELAKFPNRSPKHAVENDWGSVKHTLTVQKLWELLPEGFVLMESDVLLKDSIDMFFRPEYSFVGYVQKSQPGNKFGIGRILPMLCWFNVPLLQKEGAVYFDSERSWHLHENENDKRNWYDTGACLLEDVLAKRPRLKGLHVDIRAFLVHYGSGSWYAERSDLKPKDWLEKHKDLWKPSGKVSQK